MKKNILKLLVVSFLVTPSAFAADKKTFKPYITGKIPAELRYDGVFSANRDAEEVDNIYMEVSPELNFHFSEFFTVENLWKFKQVKAASDNEDRFFSDQAIYIEEIKAKFANDIAAIYFGKFNSDFGLITDDERGIWTDYFSEDYAIRGKIGVGVQAKFDFNNLGNHNFNIDTFFSDTTPLSDTIFAEGDNLVHLKGQNKTEKGGSGNTETFSSYVLGLEGSGISALPNLKYQIGYRSIERGDAAADTSREEGFVVGMSYDLEISNNAKLTPIFEYSDINNFSTQNANFSFHGYPSLPSTRIGQVDAEYLTFGAIFDYLNWEFVATGAQKDFEFKSGAKQENKQFAISAAYKFTSGVKLAVGRRQLKTITGTKDFSSILLSHAYEF